MNQDTYYWDINCTLRLNRRGISDSDWTSVSWRNDQKGFGDANGTIRLQNVAELCQPSQYRRSYSRLRGGIGNVAVL